MKKTIIFALLFCGCMPQQKLMGRLIDTSGPVADAAVLGMIWVEDAAKALPAPEINSITPEDRDVALDKDMAARGLPAAYSRTFSDKGGHFTIAKLHFSSETEQAIKAMKQPRITRVTLWAFQRNYRKQAVTLFPKQGEDVSPATLLLLKPADWKELYRDNTVDTLTQDYMVKGYSKEFGATKQEKRWLLEYTHSNLWKAYVDSDIKGDKEMTELCGRDYSGVTVSTAGIAWDQTHERCAELKKRMGAVREIEESWISHSNKSGDALAAAKEVVRQAIALLPTEASEPKEYESLILAGLEDAANAKNKEAVLSANPGLSMEEEAKLQYGKGDKASAYRAMGKTIFTQIPEEIKRGELTAQLAARTIPGIRETAAGFYLLMNRPLTAQLPGGDGGNHKDNLKELDISSETISEADAGIKLVEEELVFKDEAGQLIVEPALNGPEEVLKKHHPRKLTYVEAKKLGVSRLYFKGMSGAADKTLPLETKTEELKQGKEKILKRIISNRPVFSKNNNWVLVDRSIVESQYEIDADGKKHYGYDGQTTTGRFDLYDSHGLKRYNKEFVAGRGVSGAYPNIVVADNGTVAVPTDDKPGGGNPIVYVFDASGQLILEYSHADVDIGGASIDKISPNGRYLAIRASFNYASTVTVFFDLKTKKSWKAEQDYVIYEITNDGFVRCDYYDDKKQAPSLTTVMDIKPYLRE